MNPSIDGLPAISPLAPTLLGLDWESNDATPRLLRVLTSEPMLGARLIGIANSAAYGHTSHRFDSIESALQRIGLRRAIQLCGTLLLGQPMSRALSDELSHALWLHALTMAFAAEEIARIKHLADPHTAYFPGLVHDIGYMAMEYLQPGTLSEVVLLTLTDHLSAEEAESRLLGTDHAELAARLLEHWRVPEHLIAPIRQHHALDIASDSMAAILFGAEKVARCDEVVESLYAGLDHPFAPLTIDRIGVAFLFSQQLELADDALGSLVARIVEKVDGLREMADSMHSVRQSA